MVNGITFTVFCGYVFESMIILYVSYKINVLACFYTVSSGRLKHGSLIFIGLGRLYSHTSPSEATYAAWLGCMFNCVQINFRKLS